LQNDEEDSGAGDNGNGQHKNIYQFFHSQKIWFTRDVSNGHQKAADEHLERCDELLEDCTTRVDALEEILANTPKPSEVLDWRTIW
jgi:hypothetical protein